MEKRRQFQCTIVIAILFYTCLISFETGRVLKDFPGHLLTLTPLLCLLLLLLYSNRANLSLHTISRDPLFLSLGLFAAVFFAFCAVDSFAANSLRRAIPFMLAPLVYISFSGVSSSLTKNAALITLALYCVFIINNTNTQVVLIHAGALAFLCLSSHTFLNLALLFCLGSVAFFYRSFSGVLVASFGGLLTIHSRVLQFLFFAPAFVGGFLFHKTLLSSNSISSRLAFWKHAFNQFLDSPLFGDGLGLLYPIYHGKLLPHAHNFYLSVLGEMGLVGASCMLLIGMTTIAARKKLSTSTRTALFALLIWNLFDEPFYWLLPVTVTAILLSRERETVKGSNS